MKTIALKNPLHSKKMFGKNVIEIISLRDPKVKDLFGLSFDPSVQQEMMVKLVSRLSGISEADLQEMEISDWLVVSMAVTEMINKGRS